MAGGLQEFGEGRARPFLTGLLGLTRYAAEGDDEIRFVVSAGGGVKLRPAASRGRTPRRSRVHDVRRYRGAYDCVLSGFCLVTFNADIVWQAEFSAGLIIAF